MWEGRSFQAWVFCVETCPLAASSILFHWMFAVTERTSLSDILDKQRSINKCLFLLLLFPKCISRCEISLDIPFLFFSIVFVPMVENSSWSLTFEEVSWFSLICVCLYSCLSLKKKCSIILLIVTRLPQLCKSCARREGGAEESCVLLFKWYQLWEMVWVSEVWCEVM